MARGAETEQDRSKRHYQRTLFDGVAVLYEASRLGYPSDIVEFVVATAALGADSSVLEVGCGTGQLTERLAGFGFSLTAIDIGPSMIATARRRLEGSAVTFLAASFEDFPAADASFDLIVSGAAFHWIDPEVKFRKSAQLLRPGGWLAVLDIDEHYDDPLGAALTDMWVAHGDASGAWVKRASDAELITHTGWFSEPIHRTSAQRIVRPADVVIGVEATRATSLSWPENVRRGFTEELARHLEPHGEVHLTQQTSVTMARIQRHPG
ncbi:MAG TPA: class I SAM-dependent methyltransferase [Streptosporangiaceae bacterium]|nr:class I SAM-dependent methyltransferase [Streptosporangiaceae bacterium]